MINGHGDDYFNFHHIESNFSSNVYQSPAIPALTIYLSSQLHLITQYPEPDGTSLKALISDHCHIDHQQLWITNGAIEAIYLIAQAFQNQRAVIISPTFSEYEDASHIHSMQIEHIKNLDEFTGNADLLWLCNPNNPTGDYYSDETLMNCFQKFPDTTFVIDESYRAFINLEQQNFSFKNYPNVITLHSLTKCFAIPGLRLGYFSASIELIEKISRFAMPWSVNQLALQAGKFLIQHREQFKVPIQQLRADTESLRAQINCISGLTALPTATHFFLVHIDQAMTAAELKHILGNEYGILIRDCANITGLSPYYFRLATQQAQHNEALIDALEMIFN